MIVTLEVNQNNVNDKLIKNRAKTTKPAAVILKKGKFLKTNNFSVL